MKKQILSLAIVSTLSLSSLLGATVSAEGLSDLKQQEKNVNQERSNIKENIKQKESKIDELKEEQAEISSEIKRLDFAVEDATNKLEEKNAQIKQTQQEVDQLKEEIEELVVRIDKRNELLKERAVSYQENGGTISYLDVLFGAHSFSDFIDRVGAVATLVQADKDILEQHQSDKEELEAKRAEVEAKLAELQQMKADLEELKKELDRQIAEKNKLMNKLKKEEEHMHAEMIAAEEEESVLAAQASAIKQAIKMEQDRLAEIERQRRAASNSNSAVAAAPAISSGSFTWPAAGRVSSGYGSRSLGNHFGIDIAKSGSNVPIVAAADGVVIKSYYSSSYGNAIFVSHSVDGQVYTTVYAHMSSRSASSGSVVKKGERIGTMGNTGQSYGQHLHFEIHKGPWNASKSNSVNPMSYLP